MYRRTWRIAPTEGMEAFDRRDALINATLLHGFVEPEHGVKGWDAFVVSYYKADASPYFLLRPPPGWPHAADWSASAELPVALRQLHRRLYERRPSRSDVGGGSDALQWHSLTYGEIIRALKREGIDNDDGGLLIGRLLGGHSATNTERTAESGGRDRRAADVLAEVLAQLPHKAIATQGVGGNPFAVKLRGNPEDALVRALRALIRRTLAPGLGELRRSLQAIPVWTADASRDRRAPARRHAARVLGAPAPLLFLGEAFHNRPRADGAAAIYLDVSGSMGDWVNRLHASLVPLRRLLAPKCFAFSSIVEELTRAEFVRGRMRTTGGTDITPVLAHLTVQARGGRVRRALLLTDGLVGSPDSETLQAFLAAGAELHVGLVGGCMLQPCAWAASVTRLDTAR